MNRKHEKGLVSLVVLILIIVLAVIVSANMRRIELLAKELKVIEQNHDRNFAADSRTEVDGG